MPPRNLASVLDDVIDSANFISVRRDRLTLALFLQDKEAQTMFERKVEIVGEALGLLRKHAPETKPRRIPSRSWRELIKLDHEGLGS